MSIARVSALLLAVIVSAGSPFTPVAVAAPETPLLDYAQAQTFDLPTSDLAPRQRAKSIERALERHPPPAENCSRTLGANRFAATFDDLGEALDSAGDYEAAATAYQRALDCAPRASYLRAPLATDLMYLQRYEEARQVAAPADNSEQPDVAVDTILAELDFVDERWTEAIPRLRRLAADNENDEYAAYFQCLSWLAQRASGVAKPALVSRSDPEGWPQPLLAAFRGEADEAEVAKRIGEEKDLDRRREMLTEALYYMGKRRALEGDTESGQRYLATAVNLKVHYFVEYHLATADLARARSELTPP